MLAQVISLVLGWLILALGVAAAGWLIPGIRLGGWESTLGVALVLGVFNLFFRPLLVFFTLPLVLLSLGLFIIIINTFLLLAAEWVITNWTRFTFAIDGFWNALFGAIIISLVTFVVTRFIRPRRIARGMTRR